MKRAEFTADVKRQIKERASASGFLRCEACTARVGPGEYQIDHIVSEGIAHRRRPLGPNDGKLLCILCHKDKSAVDAADLAKARRLAEKQGRIRGPSEIARRYGLAREDPPDD